MIERPSPCYLVVESGSASSSVSLQLFAHYLVHRVGTAVTVFVYAFFKPF